MGQSEEANIAVVKRFYEYLARGDRDGAYAQCMADDCVLHEAESLPYGGVYPGRELMKATLSGVTGRFDRFEYEILNYLAGGDEVVVHLHMSGVGRDSRKLFSLPVMELWRFREGKAIEMRPFLYDSAALIEALKP
ncbi:MAG: nuclear transport factor 2 family protein [Novosphingobium sp.]